jgi:hypothetical protein
VLTAHLLVGAGDCDKLLLRVLDGKLTFADADIAIGS